MKQSTIALTRGNEGGNGMHMANEIYKSLLEKRNVDEDGNTPMQESTFDLLQHLQCSSTCDWASQHYNDHS